MEDLRLLGFATFSWNQDGRRGMKRHQRELRVWIAVGGDALPCWTVRLIQRREQKHLEAMDFCGTFVTFV
jgi:hypothetical protein